MSFHFKDSLEELILVKCGLSGDTLEYVSFGLFSGLKIKKPNETLDCSKMDWEKPEAVKG